MGRTLDRECLQMEDLKFVYRFAVRYWDALKTNRSTLQERVKVTDEMNGKFFQTET